MSEVPPIRRQIMVELNPDQAFELFTARIGDWWPLAQLSVFGAEATVAFVGSELVEVLGERRTRWGRVTEWIPGRRVTFSWHPGAPEEQPSSQVSVSFEAAGDQTRVILEHSGWEAYDDPARARDEYDRGWPMVLDLYAAAAVDDEPPQPGTYTWVALLHRPGPAAPTDRPVFEDPGFGQHVEFLNRMQAAGYLVAAGPMLDAAGEGMTILRLPGEGRLEEAQRLATVDDLSVKTGFFVVSVRPWHVLMAPGDQRPEPVS